MKIWMILFLFCISSNAVCDEDALTKESIKLFFELSECLDTVPESEIKNPEHKVSKNLSLITSVIENITLELGTNDKEQKEFRELYKVAFKSCEAQINKYKAHIKMHG